MVQKVGCRVYNVGCKVPSEGLRVQGSGLRVTGFRVSGFWRLRQGFGAIENGTGKAPLTTHSDRGTVDGWCERNGRRVRREGKHLETIHRGRP